MPPERSERGHPRAVYRFLPQHARYVCPNDTVMSEVKFRIIDHAFKSKLMNRAEGILVMPLAFSS